MKPEEVAARIDHTLLRPEATPDQIKQLCAEAREYGFAAVCVNPAYVPLAARILEGSRVKVCTVIGFPLGATSTLVKVVEARDALAGGAKELDMVLNLGALKAGDKGRVQEDIRAVVEAAHPWATVKVILETGLLTETEIALACRLASEAGADYVKTSTGFGPRGASLEDVRLMRREAAPGVKVKAAGGIRNWETAVAMLQAGADRLGTSASVQIVTQGRGEKIEKE